MMQDYSSHAADFSNLLAVTHLLLALGEVHLIPISGQ